MLPNNRIYEDTYKWVCHLSNYDMSVMLLNIEFDNIKTINDKIINLSNLKKKNNITISDIKKIRKWIKLQLDFKKTRKNIESLINVFGKDKCCIILCCKKEYIDRWLNAKTFNSIEYIYKYNEKDINIDISTKKILTILNNSVTNIELLLLINSILN